MRLNLSIWYYRMIKLAELDIGNNGESIDEIIKLIHQTRTSLNNFPQEFSIRRFRSGIFEREWYNNNILKIFINIAIKLGIYERVEGNNEIITKTLNGNKLAKELAEGSSITFRIFEILKNLTENAIINNFIKDKDDIDNMQDLIERIINMSSPRTVLNIILELELPHQGSVDIELLKAIFQIYGDVVEEFRWTGEVTFGLNTILPNEVESQVDLIYGDSETKAEMGRKIEEIIPEFYQKRANERIERRIRRDQSQENEDE